LTIPRGRARAVGAMVLILVLALGTAVWMVTVTPGARWRAGVVWLKLEGRLSDVRWSELVEMLRPGTGMYLVPLVENPNPFMAITNPRTDSADVAAGAHRFAAECVSCHREGGAGPDLGRGVFVHGASDWALYQSVRHGIVGTAMPPHPWPLKDIWQVVAYIRSLDRATAAAEPRGLHLPAPNLTFATLVATLRDSSDWPTYAGSYTGQRYSELAQIDRHTVGALRLAWMYQLPGRGADPTESTPLAVGGVLYFSASANDVVALDARTGDLAWTYHRDLPGELPTCCGRVNRGLALLGNTLYLATLDARLVALDAQTGRVRWQTTVADPADGYTITGAPLALNGLVITGVAGGEYGVRGFLDAYDATTGKRVWRFYVVPAPGDPGHETWTGDSWRQGGGPTWMTGSYDAQRGVLYWGTGNPGPTFDGTGRGGANLYTNSLLALDARTGTLGWYFQFTPHDVLDYDAVEVPVLVDSDSAGRRRHLVVTANRNGFYYVLDRESGRFFTGQPYARVTWAQGLDSEGHPIAAPTARPSPAGTLLYPNVGGATNWWPPAYSPQTGLFYVPTVERPGLFYSSPGGYRRGALYMGGDAGDVPNARPVSLVRALAVASGGIQWEHVLTIPTGNLAGLLATAGNVVFGGDGPRFYALDAETGAELWAFNTGGRINAAPIAYLAGGHEQVSVVAGRALVTFALAGP